MKEKTSVTLSSDVLASIDRLAGVKYSRSAFIERVLRRYIADRERAQVNAREYELLNQFADELNAEAADTLQYQAPWTDESGGKE